MKNCESGVDFSNLSKTANLNQYYCADNDLFLGGVSNTDKISFSLEFYSCLAYKKLVVINDFTRSNSYDCVSSQEFEFRYGSTVRIYLRATSNFVDLSAYRDKLKTSPEGIFDS